MEYLLPLLQCQLFSHISQVLHSSKTYFSKYGQPIHTFPGSYTDQEHILAITELSWMLCYGIKDIFQLPWICINSSFTHISCLILMKNIFQLVWWLSFNSFFKKIFEPCTNNKQYPVHKPAFQGYFEHFICFILIRNIL